MQNYYSFVRPIQTYNKLYLDFTSEFILVINFSMFGCYIWPIRFLIKQNSKIGLCNAVFVFYKNETKLL